MINPIPNSNSNGRRHFLKAAALGLGSGVIATTTRSHAQDTVDTDTKRRHSIGVSTYSYWGFGRHPELNMEPIDDIWPEENFYGRSDHFNFARAGVPILFFFNGTHEDYHGRDDEVDRIDAEKASRITKLMFFVGAEIASRDERPQWDPESRQRIVL